MNQLSTLPSPAAGAHLKFPSAGLESQKSGKSELEKQAFEKAREFETVFLTTVVEQMFSGIKTDGPFGGGHAEQMFRSFLSQEYARNFTEGGGVGLASQVYSEILKAQEASTQ